MRYAMAVAAAMPYAIKRLCCFFDIRHTLHAMLMATLPFRRHDDYALCYVEICFDAVFRRCRCCLRATFLLMLVTPRR